MIGKTVIFITIDALRPDHLNSYDYERFTAPNLEKFAKKGSTFLNAFTNGPESPSSFATMFTGILPLVGEGGFSPLPPQKISFPEILKENGITTYGIHSNPNLSEYFNYDKGFDLFLDGERYKGGGISSSNSQSISINILGKIKQILKLGKMMEFLNFRLKGFNKLNHFLRSKVPVLTDLLLPFAPIAYDAVYITQKIISFLSKAKKSTFLWAHYMDTHDPYNPRTQNLLNFRETNISGQEREYLNHKIYRNSHKYRITRDIINKLIDLYDGEISSLDDSLGEFFKFLHYKFKKNCLIIITADHGESFYEHGYFNHQGNIYDELLKVPLFIIEIGNDSERFISQTVQLIDLPSTILDYFGIKIPEEFQGLSLLPLLEGRPIPKREYVISECYQKGGKMKRSQEEGFKLISIRSEKYKLIFDEEKNQQYFFDLEKDPEEKFNLINDEGYKSEILRFKKVLKTHLDDMIQSGEKTKILGAIQGLNLNKLKKNGKKL